MTSHRIPPNRSYLVGQRFGMLTVIDELEHRSSKGSVIYKCRCDCGKITTVNSNHLLSGHTRSCGSGEHRIVDLAGQVFGRLTVINYVERKNERTMWNCKCSCGNTCVVSGSSLTTGATKSCGCLNNEIRSKTAKERFGFVDGTSLVGISPNRALNKNNSSGYKGVHYDKSRSKWVAQITFQRKNHPLGRYDTLEEAIEARKKGEETYFASYRELKKK